GVVDVVEAYEVDREAAGLIDAPGGAVDEADLAVELAREELIGRDLVDLGQPQQAGHRDGALAALVGPEDRRLEFEARGGFDVVKGEPLLPSDRPEAFADPCSGRRHSLSPLADW